MVADVADVADVAKDTETFPHLVNSYAFYMVE